jgi:hypothetical protein
MAPEDTAPSGCSKAPFRERPEAKHFHPPNPELSEQLFSREGYIEDVNE